MGFGNASELFGNLKIVSQAQKPTDPTVNIWNYETSGMLGYLSGKCGLNPGPKARCPDNCYVFEGKVYERITAEEYELLKKGKADEVQDARTKPVTFAFRITSLGNQQVGWTW